MILVDRREYGMLEELNKLGVQCAETTLEYGDACFDGSGPGDRHVTVGCERKKLSDLINSMRDRRLSGHQLKGCWQAFDFVFLFVESAFRPSIAGEIEHMLPGRNGWQPLFKSGQTVSYKQLMAYLTTLELKGNVIVRRTMNARETAYQYAALYSWFNDKKWSQHSSHEQIYVPEPGRNGRGGKLGFVNVEPTTAYRIAAQLPGVDTVRAQAAAKYFGSVERMMAATPGDWRKVDGIGEVTAAKVWKALHGETGMANKVAK